MTEPRLPLFDWQVAAARAVCLRRARSRIAMLGGAALVALGLAATPRAHPALLWNASASVPVGLYRVADPDGFDVDDLAVAWPPEAARALADRRHYLPRSVPLLKPVAGIAGDIVCADDADISLNGRWVATRKTADRAGRPLPVWHGCRRIGDSEVFLLSTDSPDSFDGRYFGVSAARAVIGKAYPLWTW